MPMRAWRRCFRWERILGDLPFQLRAERAPGRALLFTAGKGMASPDAGPGNAELKPSAYALTTEAEARQAVREQVAKKVDFIKVWVDDRNGTVKKTPPEIYRAIIDEAHKLHTRVVAHVYYLEDAKGLARAGHRRVRSSGARSGDGRGVDRLGQGAPCVHDAQPGSG